MSFLKQIILQNLSWRSTLILKRTRISTSSISINSPVLFRKVKTSQKCFINRKVALLHWINSRKRLKIQKIRNKFIKVTIAMNAKFSLSLEKDTGVYNANSMTYVKNVTKSIVLNSEWSWVSTTKKKPKISINPRKTVFCFRWNPYSENKCLILSKSQYILKILTQKKMLKIPNNPNWMPIKANMFI